MRRMQHGHNNSGTKPARACRHVQERMSLFLDGELSTSEAQNVARHIAGCAACQHEREQWERAEGALAGARQQLPSAGDLRTGFYARLEATPSPRRPQWRLDWRVAVPALAACGLGLGWLTTLKLQSPSETNVIAFVPHSAPGQQIARGGNASSTRLPTGRSTQTAALQPDTSNSPLDKEWTEDTSAPITRSSDRNIRRAGVGVHSRFGRRASPQMARLDTRQPNLMYENKIELRRALVGPLVLRRAQTNAGADAQLPVRAKTALDVNLAEKLPVKSDVLGENQWAMSLQKSKSRAAANRDSRRGDAGLGYAVPSPVTTDTSKAAAKFGEQSKNEFTSSLPYAFDSSGFKTQRGYAFGLMETLASDARLSLKSERETITAADEGIDLQVRDTKRGFISGTRLAGQMQEQGGKRVLIIEAEDAESSTPERAEE